MLRTALAVLVIAGVAAWGQAPKDTSRSTEKSSEKVDKATAYYHFMLAHMYSELSAASRGANAEYAEKAAENYKAALKADPQTPDPQTFRSFSSIYRPNYIPPVRPAVPAPRPAP